MSSPFVQRLISIFGFRQRRRKYKKALSSQRSDGDAKGLPRRKSRPFRFNLSVTTKEEKGGRIDRRLLLTSYIEKSKKALRIFFPLPPPTSSFRAPEQKNHSSVGRRIENEQMKKGTPLYRLSVMKLTLIIPYFPLPRCPGRRKNTTQ